MKLYGDYPAIQFIGTQRSGSNLLRVMLNQLPEISAPHPPHILKTFFPILSSYGDLSVPKNFSLLANDVCEWVNVNPVPWDGITFKAEVVMHRCRTNSLIEIFRRIHELKAEVDGATFWCCKSMESVHYISEIEQSGINPHYIHIYRDGRDVALSFLKSIVGPKHIYHLAEKWNAEQRLCVEAKAKIPSTRFISVKYEEMLNNPEPILKEVCSRINVQYRSSMLDYFHSRESLNTANAGHMWENLVKPIMKDNHDKFQGGLSSNEIDLFEFVAHEMLTILGYRVTADISKVKITQSDISNFSKINSEKMMQALKGADQVDILKRLPQEELLKRIKLRASNSRIPNGKMTE